MSVDYISLSRPIQGLTVVICLAGLFGNVNLLVATLRKKCLRTKMGCLLAISTFAHTICLVSELVCVKLKLRFTHTHRDECYRSVVLYMHRLWRRGPYILLMCLPPFAFSCFALAVEEFYVNHDDLLICSVTLAAPPGVRFWGTLITFLTIVFAVLLISCAAYKVHRREKKVIKSSLLLQHSTSISSCKSCKHSDAKLLRSLSTLMFVFVCSWSASILLSHVSLYFSTEVAYDFLLSLPTFCQNYFVTWLRSPRYAKAYAEQLGCRKKHDCTRRDCYQHKKPQLI
ncbi:unnamed protein product [Caenorhabditis auriculariae]|uniref:G-protein coupled receptors family 1 profile domain-containing protein n=1 Tax=Caenorhabditis auriculariae TaxID=2777116 RepID=A0A8S1HRI0_9PELO|nr:unnamed protein product [Caenorhabditis auriculariae]